jgi:ubiquinone/menaquinone biosynthesis C-methylase UbiE
VKPRADYWKNWWNGQARHSGSDYALNRQTSLRLESLEEKSLSQFLAAVSPQKHDEVLDAGCGSGRNISILSPLVKQIVGIDYSEEMIKRARERVASEDLHNVDLMQGDVTSMQFPSASFHKVICTSVLQYLDDESCAVALRELVRVCKPGGRLVIHLKNGTSLYGLSLAILRPIAALLGKQMKPECYRPRRWYERMLENVGARVLSYDGFGIVTFVPMPQRVVRFLLECEMRFPFAPFLKKLAVNYQVTLQVIESLPASQ